MPHGIGLFLFTIPFVVLACSAPPTESAQRLQYTPTIAIQMFICNEETFPIYLAAGEETGKIDRDLDLFIMFTRGWFKIPAESCGDGRGVNATGFFYKYNGVGPGTTPPEVKTDDDSMAFNRGLYMQAPKGMYIPADPEAYLSLKRLCIPDPITKSSFARAENWRFFYTSPLHENESEVICDRKQVAEATYTLNWTVTDDAVWTAVARIVAGGTVDETAHKPIDDTASPQPIGTEPDPIDLPPLDSYHTKAEAIVSLLETAKTQGNVQAFLAALSEWAEFAAKAQEKIERAPEPQHSQHNAALAQANAQIEPYRNQPPGFDLPSLDSYLVKAEQARSDMKARLEAIDRAGYKAQVEQWNAYIDVVVSILDGHTGGIYDQHAAKIAAANAHVAPMLNQVDADGYFVAIYPYLEQDERGFVAHGFRREEGSYADKLVQAFNAWYPGVPPKLAGKAENIVRTLRMLEGKYVAADAARAAAFRALLDDAATTIAKGPNCPEPSTTPSKFAMVYKNVNHEDLCGE